MNKDRVFLQIANDLGQLSTCDRAAIGAVITRDGRCVSWGYNGAPPGLPHCSDNHHGWNPGIAAHTLMLIEEFGNKGDPHEEAVKRYGCKNATHAEANALAFAARSGISTEGGTLYVSVSPCLNCARLLIAAGIVRVVWAVTYRDPAGSTLLEQAGVEKEVILPDYLP